MKLSQLKMQQKQLQVLNQMKKQIPPFAEAEDAEYDAGFRPEYGSNWEDATGKAPAYYGQAGNDVGDLARSILAGTRYGRCAVTRVYEGLLDRPAGVPDGRCRE